MLTLTLKYRLQLIRNFLADLAWATKGIPGEAVRWWGDCHRWDRETHRYVEQRATLPSGGETITLVKVEDPDYRLWVQLGRVTNAILIVLALAVVFLVVAAL